MQNEQSTLTGYPSIDKPWMKYYKEDTLHITLPQCTMYELLYQNNKNYPDDIGLIYYDRKITYSEMFREIRNAEKAYWSLGVRENDVVVLCLVNMPETIYSLYALNHIGAIVNLVDPRTDENTFKTYIKECGTRLVVTVDIAYPYVDKIVQDLSVDRIVVISPADSLCGLKRVLYGLKNKKVTLNNNAIEWMRFIENGKHTQPEYVVYEKDKCSIMAHTGGTTGVPKTVMLSNDNMNAVAEAYHHIDIPFERGQRYFNDLPPFIVYGLSIAVHSALCLGLEVVLYPVFDSKGFPKVFAHYKPNYFCALSDHLKYMCHDKHSNINLSFLVSAGVGGDTLDTKLEEKINSFLEEHGCGYQVMKGYGMTELAATAIASDVSANTIGSVGIPLAMNIIKIMDIETKEELSYDEIGEIWISGPSVMLGYYHNKEATDELIYIDEDGKRWIKTGDLGRIDKNGLLFHEGRIRRIYLTVVEGQPAKIFPTLVENVIKEDDKVMDCVVVGRPQKSSAYYESVAFVIVRKDIDKDSVREKLRLLCLEEVPSYMRPVEYRFIDEMPHTPIGKIDFRKLEDWARHIMNLAEC